MQELHGVLTHLQMFDSFYAVRCIPVNTQLVQHDHGNVKCAQKVQQLYRTIDMYIMVTSAPAGPHLARTVTATKRPEKGRQRTTTTTGVYETRLS